MKCLPAPCVDNVANLQTSNPTDRRRGAQPHQHPPLLQGPDPAGGRRRDGPHDHGALPDLVPRPGRHAQLGLQARRRGAALPRRLQACCAGQPYLEVRPFSPLCCPHPWLLSHNRQMTDFVCRAFLKTASTPVATSKTPRASWSARSKSSGSPRSCSLVSTAGRRGFRPSRYPSRSRRSFLSFPFLFFFAL